jgi:glycosyltransferase involved in cell wall biosynthesis
MKFSVIASSPTLELSGANVLVANLLDELERGGVPTNWVVTGHNSAPEDAGWLGNRRFEIEKFPATRLADVRTRQKMLLRFLKQRSPCIYLPNFDFDMACAVSALPPENKAVLIMHCDDPVYYDLVARHGGLFNAIVCVSKYLADELKGRHPNFSERIVHIPFGVQAPAVAAQRDVTPGRMLQVAYCGRISFQQKRVQDLAAIINRCHDEKLPIRFVIAGAGPDEKEFDERLRGPLGAGVVARKGFLPNAEVLKMLEQADGLLMTSEFEGLPMVLLEAMSRGCVPVVTKTKSGVAEVVVDGESGFLLPIGAVEAFVKVLKQLAGQPEQLRQLQGAACQRIVSGGFTLQRAAADYRKTFDRLVDDAQNWPALRLEKPILPANYRLSVRLKHKLKSLFEFASEG